MEKNVALRDSPTICLSNELRGYSFLSAKPVLLLLNNDNDNNDTPNIFLKKK